MRRLWLAGVLAVFALSADGTACAEENAYEGAFFKRAVFIVSDLDRSLALWRDVLGFEADPVNDLTGQDSYVFGLMNIPEDSVVRTVSLNAGDTQVRTMLLLEVPTEMPSPREAVHRSTVVINANGRFDSIIKAIDALGLELKSANSFVTADGDAAIEQGFVDWDGNLVLVYEIRDQASTTSTSVPSGARRVPERLPPYTQDA